MAISPVEVEVRDAAGSVRRRRLDRDAALELARRIGTLPDRSGPALAVRPTRVLLRWQTSEGMILSEGRVGDGVVILGAATLLDVQGELERWLCDMVRDGGDDEAAG